MSPGSVAGLTANSAVGDWSGGPFPNKKPSHVFEKKATTSPQRMA